MLDLKRLRYFLTIVETGSLSRAATILGVAQPALSQSIASLEANLDLKLLHRSNAGVTTTEAGDILYRHAVQITKQVERATEDLRRSEGNIEGTTVIGFPVSTAALLSLPIVKATRARQANIRLQINATPSQLVGEMIKQGRIDLGIVFDDALGPELSIEPLIDEELVYFGAGDQPEGELPDISLHEIALRPLMIPGPPNSISKRLSAAFETIGRTPNIIAEIDALSSIISGVAEGLGGAVLPWAAVKHSPGARVCAYRISEPEVVRRTYLCHSAITPLSRAGALVHEVILSETRRLIISGTWKAATITV